MKMHVALILLLMPALCMAKLSFREQNYFIKDNYITRSDYLPDDETKSTDQNQDEVYAAANRIAQKHAVKVVADIGCGSGYKLLKYFSKYHTIGIEIEPNYSYLTAKYPDRTWVFGDFSVVPNLPKIDILICADVIEHVVDPDDLLNWINEFDFEYLVISTPDRDLLPKIQGSTQCLTGPPKNPHHLREWNVLELKKYLSQYFEIVDQFHTVVEWWGQTIVARKKST